MRPGRTKLRGRPNYYVGAGVRCIVLCYHNHCFCLLNVIPNGMYQYKHDALFFIYVSISQCCCCCCCCFVVVVVVVVVVVFIVVLLTNEIYGPENLRLSSEAFFL